MVIVGVCVALVVGALVLGGRWAGRSFSSPPPIDHPPPREVARRFAWYCSLVLLAGIGAGITVIGAGGRLAMRLLAVTAGDDAQGRITEADEIVGEITLDGTIGFVLFNGIFGGVVTGALYLVCRRLLPSGPWGGLVFGAGLLVTLGAVIDPLRDENPDFDIVGPGWLAVLVFTAMALAYGFVLSAFMARLSEWLPLPSTDRSTLKRYAPIALLAALAFSVTAVLVIVGALIVAATRLPVVAFPRSAAYVRAGRVVLLLVALASLPNIVTSVADILGT